MVFGYLVILMEIKANQLCGIAAEAEITVNED
jgi:hypothetical protein